MKWSDFNSNYFFGTPQRALITLGVTLVIFAITNADVAQDFLSNLKNFMYEIFNLLLTAVIMVAALVYIYKKHISK